MTSVPSYKTIGEIERRFYEGESNHDLFECLLNHSFTCPKEYADLYLKLDSLYDPSLGIGVEIGDIEEVFCRCTKIECLKLYCDCFAAGVKCGKNCLCTKCNNKDGYEMEIYAAKIETNIKHQNHFKNLPEAVPKRKCTCKKSRCQKKYCECFSVGVKCNEGCSCLDCRNGHPGDREKTKEEEEEQELFGVRDNTDSSIEVQVIA